MIVKFSIIELILLIKLYLRILSPNLKLVKLVSGKINFPLEPKLCIWQFECFSLVLIVPIIFFLDISYFPRFFHSFIKFIFWFPFLLFINSTIFFSILNCKNFHKNFNFFKNFFPNLQKFLLN